MCVCKNTNIIDTCFSGAIYNNNNYFIVVTMVLLNIMFDIAQVGLPFGK